MAASQVTSGATTNLSYIVTRPVTRLHFPASSMAEIANFLSIFLVDMETHCFHHLCLFLHLWLGCRVARIGN